MRADALLFWMQKKNCPAQNIVNLRSPVQKSASVWVLYTTHKHIVKLNGKLRKNRMDYCY